MSYTIKPRPTLFELSIMEGILNGGEQCSPVKREAYWALPPQPNNDIEQELFLKKTKSENC